MDFHTLRDEKEAQFRQEEEELRKSTESNEAKIVKLNQDLMSLEVSHDTAAQSNASLPADGKTQAQIEFDQLQMQMNAINEQITCWKTEQQTLQKDHKRRLMRRGVFFGGAGVLVGSFAAFSACRVM